MNPVLQDPLAAPAADAEAAANPAIAALLILGLVATALIGAPQQFVRPETIKATAASAFIAGALALWAWRLERTSSVRWSNFLLVPFGLALVGVISVAWSPAATALADAGRWLMVGVLIFLGLNALGRESFSGIARAVHWCALLLSLLALAEFWFDFSWFPTEAPPGANFGNRNFFAEYIVAALPFSLWMLVRPGNTPNRAAFAGLGLGFIVVALMSTGTRAALIAAVVCMGIFIAICLIFVARAEETRIRTAVVLAGLAPALLLVFTLGWLPTSNAVIAKEARGLTPMERTGSRLRSLGDDETYAEGSSFGIRRAAWDTGRKMIADHPVLGVGGGGWNSVSALYSRETEDVEIVWLAHNEPLQLVAEYGLAGWAALLALAALVAGACRGIARRLRARAQVAHALQDTVAVLSIGAFAIVSLSGLPLHASTTGYLLALCVGFLLATRQVKAFAIGTSAFPLLVGRIASLAVLAMTALVCVQGLRSDYLVQHGGGLLVGLLQQQKSLPPDAVAQRRELALGYLRRGYDIHSEHGLETPMLATALTQLGDPSSVLWLSNIALQTRPHVPALKCNIARAQSDLGKFDAASQALTDIEKTRPGATCLPLVQLDYEYKKGNFAGAVAAGQKFISAADSQTKPDNLRFVVDTAYRAAIRVPNLDAALQLLRLRAERWPELRATSWMLAGQLEAARTPGQVSPAAVDAYKKALAAATAQERPQVWSRVPENYRPLVN